MSVSNVFGVREYYDDQTSVAHESNHTLSEMLEEAEKAGKHLRAKTKKGIEVQYINK